MAWDERRGWRRQIRGWRYGQANALAAIRAVRRVLTESVHQLCTRSTIIAHTVKCEDALVCAVAALPGVRPARSPVTGVQRVDEGNQLVLDVVLVDPRRHVVCNEGGGGDGEATAPTHGDGRRIWRAVTPEDATLQDGQDVVTHYQHRAARASRAAVEQLCVYERATHILPGQDDLRSMGIGGRVVVSSAPWSEEWVSGSGEARCVRCHTHRSTRGFDTRELVAV